MKPFDLEKALAGAPVVTRNGRPVQEIYHLTTCDGRYPVIGVIDGAVWTFTKEGVHSVFTGSNALDLFMATTKREGWVNVYPSNAGWLAPLEGRVFPTRAAALEAIINPRHCIATVRIEWEE